MKGWVFLLPTVTKEDAEAYFPDHKVCQVPSGIGEYCCGGETLTISCADFGWASAVDATFVGLLCHTTTQSSLSLVPLVDEASK